MIDISKLFDLVIIGGGPAGMAAALSAKDNGIDDILIIERDKELGGILSQCVHNGFGLQYFSEELTGPEYASRFIEKIRGKSIEVLTDTMVIDLKKLDDGNNEITVVGHNIGLCKIIGKSTVLAMGCRERTRGNIGIPGSRPAGVLTAGAAQRYVNVDGFMPGKRVVILGSGDIGLIMARRMTLEGAKVLACVEAMPYSSGLNRNIVQCLKDFDIPLLLSHTVTDIIGRDRIEKIIVSKIDEISREIIPNSEIVFECDTLLLSVGLIPENELSLKAGIDVDIKTNGTVVFENMETTVDGFFACGNVCHVHDLADNVSREAELCGKAAAQYVLKKDGRKVPDLINKGSIQHFLPPSPEGASFKMGENEFICTVCPKGCKLKVDPSNGYSVSGNGCSRGEIYGKNEMLNPSRVLTTTVALKKDRIPVKTSKAIPKHLIMPIMAEIDDLRLYERPPIGTVLIKDVLGTGADVIVTKRND